MAVEGWVGTHCLSTYPGSGCTMALFPTSLLWELEQTAWHCHGVRGCPRLGVGGAFWAAFRGSDAGRARGTETAAMEKSRPISKNSPSTVRGSASLSPGDVFPVSWVVRQ